MTIITQSTARPVVDLAEWRARYLAFEHQRSADATPEQREAALVLAMTNYLASLAMSLQDKARAMGAARNALAAGQSVGAAIANGKRELAWETQKGESE